MLLTQEKHGFDIAMRAALKSASGNDFANARYYDSAGYFFDAAVGRDITIIPEQSRVRLAASGGFLCWQTANGRQNDAVMYGLTASYRYRWLNIAAEYGGYFGWEKDGDAPMTLKTSIAASLGNIDITLGHQVGLTDWPFHVPASSPASLASSPAQEARPNPITTATAAVIINLDFMILFS